MAWHNNASKSWGKLMKHTTLIMIIVVGISGCDNEKNVAIKAMQSQSDHVPITVIISPGYTVKVGGKSVPISGSDECSWVSKNVEILGSNREENSRSCIVIKPETKAVPVLIRFPNDPIQEHWTVLHEGESTLLQRPDGSYIEYAK